MSREVVEFGAKGLKELKAEVRDLDAAMKATHKSNEKLRRQLNDGSWLRAARQVESARKAMAGFRREQELLHRQAARMHLDAKYGRLGGAIAMYGGGVARGIGGTVTGFGQSALGAAAAFGAPLAVGAMASRGFQGTAAASRLDMQYTRLSRTVAEKLLPVLESFTNALGRLNNSADRVKAGTATRGDYLNNLMIKGGIAGAGFLGLKGLANIAFPQVTGAIGSATMNAMRAGVAGAGGAAGIGRASPWLAAAAAGGYMMYRGSQLGDQQDRLNALSSVTSRAGKRSFDVQFNQREFDSVRGLVDNVRGETDPGKRLSLIRDLKAQNEEATARQEAKMNRSWLNPRLYYGSIVGDDQEKRRSLLLKRHALNRLELEAQGGDAFNPSERSGMLLVAGAGERRGLTDTHQEIAEAIAQNLNNSGSGDSGESDNVVLQAIRGMLADIVGLIGGTPR